VPVAILAALVVAISTAMLLDGRRGRQEVEALVAFARSEQSDPVRLIVTAGRRHQLLFLGDLLAAPEPKRIAADAIEALAHGPGLDAVVLEVGADQQAAIDAYLESDPEDVALLLTNPQTVHERWGVAREYLEIYRRVWRLNRALEIGRRIRILAADLPGWPPTSPLAPQVAAARYAQRDAHMTERIESELLSANPRSRLLIFMSGYHGLKSGDAELHPSVGTPIPVVWLGARLRQLHPGEVFTIVVDGTPRHAIQGTLDSYATTHIYDFLRKHLPGAVAPFALPVDGRFDFLRAPLRATGVPGLDLILNPGDYTLRDVADGYIFLGSGTGVTLQP
jgi:hypothetical protein